MTREDRVRAAERLIRGRQLRAEHMGALNDAFGDAAWDMLLRLYIDGEQGRATTVGDLVDATMRAEEFAKPHLGFLASHRAVEVEGMTVADVALGAPDDRLVRLTARGRDRMEGYLTMEAAMVRFGASRVGAR